jgi:dihydroorotase
MKAIGFMNTVYSKNLRSSFKSLVSLFLMVMLTSTYTVNAQEIDLLLKRGHVIDPKNKIDQTMDVAIKDGKIFKIAANIPVNEAKKVVDVNGLYVAPGLIDIHTHVFVGSENGFANGFSSVSPDDFTFKSGVTTVVDAGTSGWRNFPLFKEQVIDRSQTRVLAFLNIFGSGFSSGSAIEPSMDEADPQKTAEAIRKYPEFLVGSRIGHYSGKDWTPFDRALEAAKLSNTPLLVECHLPEYTLEDQLNRMRSGDIITHAFENVSERMPVVDERGIVRPFVLEAQARGVLFDVGHGGAGFWFNQAVPALKQGLAPNSFGTDLHRFSMNAGMKSMLNIMSKYLTMGMGLQDVIARGSWYPAKSIKREDLGNLSEGTVADIAVLSLLPGKFGFVDAGKERIDGDSKLEAELTIRGGRVVWDLNGLSATAYE